jgi:hypothetical protein
MFMVFWYGSKPYCKKFENDKLVEVLKYMEELRNNKENSFVTLCSENPNSVGKPGVVEVSSDYNWTKRRGNMPKARK